MANDYNDQVILNEKLQFKIIEQSENVVSFTEHEKITSELNIANSQIKYKTGKIVQLSNEVEQLMALIREMHYAVEQQTVSPNHTFTPHLSSCLNPLNLFVENLEP